MQKWKYIGVTALISFTFGAAKAETTLSVSYANPSVNKPIQEEIAREFQKSHPDIKIILRSPVETYDDVINDLLRSNITGDLPDIAFIGANHISVVAKRGIAIPISKIQQELDGLGYYPSILSAGNVSGRQYGIPFAVSLPVLHINVDLVEKAGGSLNHFPSTWEGITDLGKKISALDGKPVGFTYQYDGWGSLGVGWLVASAGGRMDGKNGCGTGFDTPEGRWAFDMLQMFHDKGMPAMTQQQVRQAFAAGAIGIAAASGSTIVKNEEQANGKFRYKTIPFPIKSPDGGTLPAGGTIVITTAKGLDKQEAASKYIKFVTGPVAQSIMVKNSGYLPVSQTAVETPEYLGDYFKKHPNQATQLAQMKALSRWYVWPGENGIKIFAVTQDYIDAIVGGKASAEQTVPNLIKAIEGLLPPCITTSN